MEPTKGILLPSEITNLFPSRLNDALAKLPKTLLQNISEIRLRADRAVSLTIKQKNILLNDEKNKLVTLTFGEISAVFERLCENSFYIYENEMCLGYITLKGGHRVGFCGSIIQDQNEKNMVHNISSLNFRIGHDIKNAAEKVFPYIYDDKLHSCLIVSEPCGGKTTILTDVAFRLSALKIRSCVIDERGEICACFLGVPQKNVGNFCDVLDGYTKGEGMMIALRSLSPQVLICDEIGTSRDVEAMLEAMRAGVPVIATAHGATIDELLSRPQIRHLLDNGAIDKIILLKGASHPGEIDQVIEVDDFDQDFWNSNDYI